MSLKAVVDDTAHNTTIPRNSGRQSLVLGPWHPAVRAQRPSR